MQHSNWTSKKEYGFLSGMTDERKIRIGQNLTTLMKRRGISLTQTARRNGMSPSTLHNYICGMAPRNLQALAKLSEFFGISISDLLFGDPASENMFALKTLATQNERYEITLIVDKIKKIDC